MINSFMANESNLAKLRQSSIASIVNAAGVMAGINEAEQRGELTAEQANLTRETAKNKAALDLAQIRGIKAEAANREALQPGIADAQTAQTELQRASAGNIGAQQKMSEALLPGAARAQSAQSGLQEAQIEENTQNARRLKRMTDPVIPFKTDRGEDIMLSIPEAIQMYDRYAQNARAKGDLTAQQRYIQERNEVLDRQKRIDRADSLEGIINNPQYAGQDLTPFTRQFNAESEADYVYYSEPQNAINLKGGTHNLKRIPLPQIRHPDGSVDQYTASDVVAEWREAAKKNPNLADFKKFLVHLYTNVVKQPLPPELK